MFFLVFSCFFAVFFFSNENDNSQSQVRGVYNIYIEFLGEVFLVLLWFFYVGCWVVNSYSDNVEDEVIIVICFKEFFFLVINVLMTPERRFVVAFRGSLVRTHVFFFFLQLRLMIYRVEND